MRVLYSIVRRAAQSGLPLALLAAGCSQSHPAGDLTLASGEASETPSPAAPANDDASRAPQQDTFPDGTPVPSPANSQTGSPGAVECYEDLECFGGARVQISGPLGHVELLGAACVHLSAQDLPVCECRMLKTLTAEADAGTPPADPYEVKLYPGNRPDGCSEWSRAPGCLYCEHEFPGCSIDDAASCDAVCAEMTERFELDQQKTITATARLARCAPEALRCQVVTEIDGVCYGGAPERIEPPVLDCDLSDAELAQRSNEPSVPACAERPAVTCNSGGDCPRGLGCNAGVCGPCSEQCMYPEGRPEEAVCEGDSACAAGELCSLGMCLPSDNVGCRSFTECPAENSCVLSGFSSAGRGNEVTRSLCQPYF